MSDDHSIYGLSIDDIVFNFKKLDAILKMDRYNLEICLIGGTACLLTGHIDRVTIDYDLLNLDYGPRVRNYLNFFNPYDLVDFEATTIPRSYQKRTEIIYKGEYVLCKILGIEDIILSKLCRNMPKDFDDIDKLIKNADIELLIKLIDEVKNDIATRYPRIQENLIVSLVTFRNRYNLIF